jgi:hypothetical protein
MRSSAHKARDILPKIVEQSMQDMIWNAKAVNRSSKCNPGSQTIWFEKSLPVVQRKSLSNNRVLAQTPRWGTKLPDYD